MKKLKILTHIYLLMDMSTNDLFHEQSCENNTMEEPSAVEEHRYSKMQLKHQLL